MEDRRLGLVLVIIDFAYLLLSTILLFPKLYFNSTENVYYSTYGAACVVYSVGVLYGFFDKLLSQKDSFPEKRHRIIGAINIALSVSIIAIILIYYYLTARPFLLYFVYAFVVIIGMLPLYEAVVLTIDFVKYG